ncbi:MAG: hypothetical protein MI749_09740 [Desulfovibrionales bacterium]|nr:hypothetical protein [Desulfovibrionales bacterium]
MSLIDSLSDSMFKTMQKSADDVASYSNKGQLSEMDMIKFRTAAEKYSTMTTLVSGLMKSLTDTQKGIVSKM